MLERAQPLHIRLLALVQVYFPSPVEARSTGHPECIDGGGLGASEGRIWTHSPNSPRQQSPTLWEAAAKGVGVALLNQTELSGRGNLPRPETKPVTLHRK